MISKRSQGVVAVIAFIAVITLLYFFGDEKQSEVVFSREAGFYDDSFYLEISAPPGMKVYYTLDGSIPTAESMLYEAPILIEDASVNDNVYSARDDLSAYMQTSLYADIENIEEPDHHFEVPDFKVDKCTVLRAVGIDDKGNATPVKTANYFVNFDEKVGYEGLYIVALNTDSDNFFGYENGIYIMGKTFDDYYSENPLDDDFDWWKTNYRQLGPDWERETNVCIYYDGKNIVNQDATVRTQGGISRAFLPRSLNIKAKDADGKSSRFYGLEFPGDYFADAINLSSGGNRYLTKMNDYMIHSLVKDRAVSTMNYYPCALFIDGEYWGVYHFSEKYDDTYFEDHYDIDSDQLIFIKSGTLHEGLDSDLIKYQNLMTYMEETDFSVPENYYELCQQIDIQSCLDYYAIELYIARQGDWPIFNEGLYRSRDIGRSEYADGKWRWALYDVNSTSLKGKLVDDNTIKRTRESDNGIMFNSLCNSPIFREQFVITMMDIINTDFSVEKTDKIIDDYVERMQCSLEKSAERFCGSTKEIFINTEIGGMKEFLQDRKSYFARYMAEEFGLDSNLITVGVSVNDDSVGIVKLNTIVVPFEEGSWQGDYFRDYPVSLTAIPLDGYHFVGWTGDYESTDISIVIPLDVDKDSLNVQAVFEKNTLF